MPTIRDFMSDIKATLGLGIDDAEWSDGALAYNVGLNIDLLKKQYLDRRMSRGDDRSVSQEISTFLLPIADETETGRRYFTMPAPVFELAHGGGIAFISYVRTDLPVNCAPQVARVQYSPTTWQELMLIEADPIQRPSKPRPRYIRGSRQRTYLFGQDADIQTLEVGLYLTFPPLTEVDIDQDIPLPAHLIEPLRRMTLQQGNWLMLQPQERLLNDGRANNVGERVPQAPRLISVNDSSQITGND